MLDLASLNGGATTILAAILNSLAAAGAIALSALFLLRLLRNANASTRHTVWWLVLAAVLVVAPVRSTVDWLATRDEPVLASAPLADPPAQEVASIEVPSSEPAPAAVEPDSGVRAGYLPLVLSGFVAICLITQAARVLCSYRYLRALKKSGIEPPADLQLSFEEWLICCSVKRPVKLLLSDAVASPVAVGFRHPAVIIPRNMVGTLSADDLDHMLLHELAHLARRDDWTNLLARLAWGVLFFHPVAVWLLRRIDEEREIACDDWVVSTTGGAKQYALSLSRLIEFRLSGHRELLATGIGGRQSRFGDRIERLLRASDFRSKTSVRGVALAVVVLLCTMAIGTQSPSWITFAQDEPPVPAAPPLPPEPVTPAKAPVPPTPRTPKAVAAVRAPALLQPRPAVPPAPPAPPSPPSFLQALSDAGYRDLSVEELIDLKNHGVSASYLAAMNQAGWGRLTTQQLIDLRNSGVSPDYLKELKTAGFSNLTLTDVKDLRNHGVRADSIRQVHALGFGPYSVEQVRTIASHGLTADFFEALKTAGFLKAELKDILDARMNGLTAASLQEARRYGSQLTLRQIIRLKQAGVI